jgi:hypothetical protein
LEAIDTQKKAVCFMKNGLPNLWYIRLRIWINPR